jgi:hypothetical protein
MQSECSRRVMFWFALLWQAVPRSHPRCREWADLVPMVNFENLDEVSIFFLRSGS